MPHSLSPIPYFPMTSPSTPQTDPTWLSIIKLLRWNKPAGRFILMVPALWAVFLAARGTPPLPLVGVIIVGTFVTSAAGCVINDLWDRNIDPEVERTRSRPLASRALSIQVGVAIAILALLCAAVLALYLNRFSFLLCVAAVPVIVFYPTAKRVFPVPQLVLSIAWGFAVLISWSAVTANLEPATWVLWSAVILWTLAFDTVYALPDRQDDERIGVNSSALFFGDKTPIAVGIFFTGTAVLLALESQFMALNWTFWLGWSLAIIFWAKQVYDLLQPEVSPTLYSQIFGQNVMIGFVLLAAMISGTLLA
nr:4-hydroxybenzoate solanesyltransferase [Roseofilum sp. Belize Diploria]